MERSFPNNIREGMNVCDRDGDKIGTVGHIYWGPTGTGTFGTTSTGMGGTYSVPGGGPGTSGHLKIDTGFLGLGKDLYVPFSSISGVREDCVFLTVGKDQIDTMGWDVKPDYIR